jgi:hypothetical protein
LKNQNDMIIMIVAVVVCLAGAAVLYFTSPDVPTIAAPQVVDVSAPVIQSGSVVTGSSLPGGGGGGGGFGGGAAGGRRAGGSRADF